MPIIWLSATEVNNAREDAREMHSKTYGPAIGTYLGKTIYKSIREDDHEYVFDRIAESDDDGIPLTQLKRNEVLFEPGLIYRQA